MATTRPDSAQARLDPSFTTKGLQCTHAFAFARLCRMHQALATFRRGSADHNLVRRASGLILILLTLGGCSLADVMHNDSKSSAIIPALRYVVYEDGRTLYEDISNGNPEIAAEIANIPVAHGAMTIDCANLREIGILIRHAYRSRGKYYGRHDYNYVVSWPDKIGSAPKHFTYEDQLRSWYLRGAARFLEPLSDGPLSLAVTHRREAIYTTEFNMVGCP